MGMSLDLQRSGWGAGGSLSLVLPPDGPVTMPHLSSSPPTSHTHAPRPPSAWLLGGNCGTVHHVLGGSILQLQFWRKMETVFSGFIFRNANWKVFRVDFITELPLTSHSNNPSSPRDHNPRNLPPVIYLISLGPSLSS